MNLVLHIRLVLRLYTKAAISLMFYCGYRRPGCFKSPRVKFDSILGRRAHLFLQEVLPEKCTKV